MSKASRAGWTAIFIALTAGPVLLATLTAPPGWQLLGGLANPDDTSVYLAAMMQGARGAWLYRSPFDPTPAPAVLMYSLYLGLGRLTGLGLEPVLVYHLARLVWAVAVLALAASWTRTLFPHEKGRTSAWLLVAFSSGLGWLLALVPSDALQSQWIDLRLPEANTFLASVAAPHFAAGIALQAAALLAYWRAVSGTRWLGWSIACGAALLGLGLIYPFTLPVVGTTIAGYVVWSVWRRGAQVGRQALAAAAVSGGIVLPFALYYVHTFLFEPFWRTSHIGQNIIPTPGPLRLAAGYGLPLALAIWGGARVWREKKVESPWILICLWTTVNLPLLYLPLPFQWRLANGWHFGLALLAARGLEECALPWLRQRARVDLRRAALMLNVPSTLLVVLFATRVGLTTRGFQVYFPNDELAAMEQLSAWVDYDDVVLGAYPTGNVLPTRALCRVVAGQQFATLDVWGKLEDVQRFYAGETLDAERRDILARYGVTVVYHGRWERELGAFEPAAVEYLQEMFSRGETVVYRVVGERSAGVGQ